PGAPPSQGGWLSTWHGRRPSMKTPINTPVRALVIPALAVAFYFAAPARTSHAATPTEGERVQRFLDDRYKSSDIHHSFTTKFGEAIDCIDFMAQPGVKALVARGESIVRPSTPPQSPFVPTQLADVAFTGQPDQEGRPRACPDGSVPMLRISTSDIAKA